MGSSFNLRDEASLIIEAALEAVEPGVAVRGHLRLQDHRLTCGDRTYDLDQIKKVLVVGAGKAGVPMARTVEEVLADRVSAGHVVVPHGRGARLHAIDVHEASHPIPDQSGVEGGRAVLSALQEADEQTLVICLLSGGGSALLVCPAEGIGLADLSATSEALLACCATIVEINAVRKHLSALKGGQLARAAAPAPVLTLILSDVCGDPLDAIASGPTAPDSTSFSDCLAIIDRYEIRDKLPAAIVSRLESGAAGELPETPKHGDPVFENVHNVVVANNDRAVRAAARAAEARGYRACVLSTLIEGETREVAKVHVAIAKEVQRSGRPVQPPACIISGGETTVTLCGKGNGGRNQEFALSAALGLAGVEGILVCSVGTDGIDGPTDAAGAWADGQTVERAAAAGHDALAHLAENDAYPFFAALDDLVITGPTDTNVMDLRFLLVR